MLRTLLCLLLVLVQAKTDRSYEQRCSSSLCSCCKDYTYHHPITLHNRGEIAYRRQDSCYSIQWSLNTFGAVKINFRTFKLAPNDVIRVYDDTAAFSSLIATFTGKEKPHTVLSTGQKLSVRLQTTCDENPRDLRVSYSKQHCGGLLWLNKKGRATLAYPQGSRRGNNCLWLIRSIQPTDTPRDITVTIKTYNFRPQYESLLQIQRADKKENALVANITKNVKSTVRLTNSGSTIVRFFTHARDRASRFVVKVFEHESDCNLSDCQRIPSSEGLSIRVQNACSSIVVACCPGYEPVSPMSPRESEHFCTHGKWHPAPTLLCKRKQCPLPYQPKNATIAASSKSYLSGDEVIFKCTPGKSVKNYRGVITTKGFCQCDGMWMYKPTVPECENTTCLDPPPSPPGGGRRAMEKIADMKYPVGTIVNYTCPSGYGLSGIPFRVCNSNGKWSSLSVATTELHSCEAGLQTCPDPGLPLNAVRSVVSFHHLSTVSYFCKKGYELYGSATRTCHAFGTTKYWTGRRPMCSKLVKSPYEVAVALHDRFLSKLTSCSLTNSTGRGQCKGLSRPVPTKGCKELIFAIDCSQSVTENQFNNSLKFAEKIIQFLEEDVDKVAVLTFDQETDILCNLSNPSSALKNVQSAPFCAGNTNTQLVLNTIRQKVLIGARNECKQYVFLLTDGHNNWGGNSEKEAEKLKQNEVELHAIAFSDDISRINIHELRKLISPGAFLEIIENEDMMEETIRRIVSVDSKADKSKCGHSDKGTWPWIAAIYEKMDPPICVGVIISKNQVLTAAHCIEDRNETNLRVVTGQTTRLEPEGTEITYEIQRNATRVHNSYNRITYDNDIAIISLDCCLEYNSAVQPICVSKTKLPITNGTVTGWGRRNRTGVTTTDLKVTRVTPANQSDCDKAMTNKSKDTEITDNMFCGTTNRDDMCKGDSGGPYMIKDSNGFYTVAGVVSWHESGSQCTSSYSYTVFASLMSEENLEWISEELKNAKPCSSTNCGKRDIV